MNALRIGVMVALWKPILDPEMEGEVGWGGFQGLSPCLPSLFARMCLETTDLERYGSL